MSGHKVRVLLADDHTALLDGLRMLLEPTYDVVATVADGHALLQAAVVLEPDVIVSDIAMPGLNGLEAATRIKERLPGVRLVFFTIDSDADVAAEALRRGAAGYVVKSRAASVLLDALRQVVAGGTYVALA